MMQRHIVAQWLEPSSEHNKRYLWVDLALILLIGLNIIALILQSIETIDHVYHRHFFTSKFFQLLCLRWNMVPGSGVS
ncbi:hypothetical protein Q3O60_15960 [Alkalimonas collagenimarina]|uniref:Uncharacterized protein n=1 Tax=Alkalimonas collagenimarina TaxID=400390 RepID=A0ABT9H315_9GAMM|nr:hypothetical protein [Alkalimonas collagenimarina]MDP4537682.1 hypothetical protein [Alkalimonas collagenimarina]